MSKDVKIFGQPCGSIGYVIVLIKASLFLVRKILLIFFTKALPVARHKVLAPFFAVDNDSSDSIDLKLSTILFAASFFSPRTKRVS
jgi:hypothetical protein